MADNSLLRRCLRRLIRRWQKKTPKPIGWGARLVGFLSIGALLCVATAALLASFSGLLLVGHKVWETGRDLWPDGETSGQIIVDSPKIYTRERLVNDRLEEASWLADQLKESRDQLFSSQFQSIVGRSTIFLEKQLSASDSAASTEVIKGKPQATAVGSGPQTLEPKDALRSKEGTDKGFIIREPTIDRFRDLHTFRDEVRAEMMQTQLDDRHDIAGNTIYRLTFDTTIAAGPNTRGLAGIEAEVSHDLKSEDYDGLFSDWQSHVQKQADRLLASDLRALLTYGFGPADINNFVKYFFQKLCYDGYDESISAICVANVKQFIEWYEKAHKDRSRDIDEKSLKIAWSKLAKSTNTDLYDQFKDFCSASGAGSTTRSFVPAMIHRVPKQGIPCPQLEENIPQPYYRLFAILDLYDRKHIAAKDLELLLTRRDYKPDQMRSECGSWRSSTGQVCLLDPKRDLETIRCRTAQYTADNLKSRAPEIAQYFDVKVDGLNELACRIRIDPVCSLELAMSVCSGFGCNAVNGISNSDIEQQPYCITSARDRLKQKLAHDITIFSYGVTPKNLVQRLSIASGDDDALAAIAMGKLSDKLTLHVLQVLQERSRRLELTQGLPIVVGYGLGRSSSPTDETEGVRAHFGWLIAPALRGGTDWSVSQNLHTTQQYSLAAVISIPSWWRRIKVDYRWCWVDPRGLRILPRNDLGACPGNAQHDGGVIALPGRVDEIARKLGFWVINEPSLEEEQRLLLTPGTKRSLVIRGTRLWRSTMVTLGSQKADRIEVLPNMNGIIATFDCLPTQNVPTQNVPTENVPTQYVTKLPLQVWTSEGVTAITGVEIENSNPPFHCPDDNFPVTPVPVDSVAVLGAAANIAKQTPAPAVKTSSPRRTTATP